jgi:hypothetical protein
MEHADAPEDADLDRLYQVAPAEFVAARNALAARLKADGRRQAAARVKALARPSATAWAVNQLCWQARGFLERLLDSGEALRAAQESGSAEALREAMRGRREALASARDRALSLLRHAGHAATPAAEQRVSNTLLALATHGRRLPAGIVAGRLEQDLEPPGFDALAGLTLPEPPARPDEAPLEPAPAPSDEPAAAPDAAGTARREERERRESERAALRAELQRRRAEEAQRGAEHDAALHAAREAFAAEERTRGRVEALRRELEQAEEAARAAAAEAERVTAAVKRAEAALSAAAGARVRLEIALDPAAEQAADDTRP